MTEQGTPANEMQAVWFRLGQHDAAIAAHERRSTQIETDMKEGFAIVHRRFDGVKSHLDKQDEQRANDKAEIMGAISELREVETTQKARRGVWRFLGARVEFLLGAAIGFAGSYIGSR